jgi:hypothetical protein
MALAETIGRHLTNLEGNHDDLVNYYINLSEELRKEFNFQGRTREEIDEMRLETILWCKDKLESLTKSQPFHGILMGFLLLSCFHFGNSLTC